MIAGRPMIQRAYEQVMQAADISRIIVATDDERIYRAVRQFHGEAVMTGNCSCGTERVYEAIRNDPCDIVINVQGDEPLIKPEMINELVDVFIRDDVEMATLCKEITEAGDIDNPNMVKVVRDLNDHALFFSRYPIPFDRDGKGNVKHFKHIGIYGYRKDFLKKYVQMQKMPLEMAENLEQLRVLEHGYQIKVIETMFESMGVDTPEDILKIEKQM